MVDGHRRDDIANDIARGYPTLSAEADALAADVMRLSTFNERDAFGGELGSRAAASPFWGEWVAQTDQYLAEFDPDLVQDIEHYLAVRRDKLRKRAADRGWEVPD